MRSPLKGDVRINAPAPTSSLAPYKILCTSTRFGRSGCLTCPVLQERNVIVPTATGQRFPIVSRLSCASSFVVYVLMCTVCNKQYVGKTTKRLNIRRNHHREKFISTRGEVNSYLVYKHFDVHGREAMSVTPFKASPLNDGVMLLTMEEATILELTTYIPFGLNSLFHNGSRLPV